MQCHGQTFPLPQPPCSEGFHLQGYIGDSWHPQPTNRAHICVLPTLWLIVRMQHEGMHPGPAAGTTCVQRGFKRLPWACASSADAMQVSKAVKKHVMHERPTLAAGRLPQTSKLAAVRRMTWLGWGHATQLGVRGKSLALQLAQARLGHRQPHTVATNNNWWAHNHACLESKE